MKNKKGILIKTTLGIVVAVVCLVFLYGVGYKFAEAYIGDRELEKVKSYSVQLEDLINNLEEGEEEDLMVLGFDGWLITGWPDIHMFEAREPIPEKCSVAGWAQCICFCNDYSCDEKVVCIDARSHNSLIVSQDKDGRQNNPVLMIDDSAISIKMKLNNGELRLWKNEEES